MQTLLLINGLALLMFISGQSLASSADNEIIGNAGSTLVVESFGEFEEPWAMTFLPNGNLLVTEKAGALQLVNIGNRSKVAIAGVPKVAYRGQGGFGDIILDPHFTDNQRVYFSYAEQDTSGKRGAAVVQAQLQRNSSKPKLINHKLIWRQYPKVSGSGHYSHRLAFSPGGQLFITSGDRQKQSSVQKLDNNLGKVIRINTDGSVPADNPIQNKGELAKTFWSIGHRNMLGIAFDSQARLWTHEMGPRHGDELNLTVKGENYGWPIVSWGDQYYGVPIPDHDKRPEFNAPELYWVPTVAPSGLTIYSGKLFPEWQGNAFIGGLRSQALLRIKIEGDKAVEAERFDMNARVREIEQGPNGALWVLEDGQRGRLLRLTQNHEETVR